MPRLVFSIIGIVLFVSGIIVRLYAALKMNPKDKNGIVDTNSDKYKNYKNTILTGAIISCIGITIIIFAI